MPPECPAADGSSPRTTRFNGPPPTTRIGEYFGVDLFANTVHLAWNGPNPIGGTQTGHQVIYDRFAIPGTVTVSGDDAGTTNDAFTLRRIQPARDIGGQVFVNPSMFGHDSSPKN